MASGPPLDEQEVLALLGQAATSLTDDSQVHMVGGQALWFWANHYAPRSPDLARLTHNHAITTSDLDFYGNWEAADRFAKSVGGRAERPSLDNMATPSSAVVSARLGERQVWIDFLDNVAGVPREDARRHGQLILPALQPDGSMIDLPVRLMHPVECFKSRIANVLQLKRLDARSTRQAEASFLIVREFIRESIEQGAARRATQAHQRLFEYARSDFTGRQAHRRLGLDPMAAIEDLSGLDTRYREHSLAAMREEISRRRRQEPPVGEAHALWPPTNPHDPAAVERGLQAHAALLDLLRTRTGFELAHDLRATVDAAATAERNGQPTLAAAHQAAAALIGSRLRSLGFDVDTAPLAPLRRLDPGQMI